MVDGLVYDAGVPHDIEIECPSIAIPQFAVHIFQRPAGVEEQPVPSPDGSKKIEEVKVKAVIELERRAGDLDDGCTHVESLLSAVAGVVAMPSPLGGEGSSIFQRREVGEGAALHE